MSVPKPENPNQPSYMKINPLRSLVCRLAVITIAAVQVPFMASAVNVYKGSAGTDLTLGASWTNSVVPNASSNAVWVGSALGTGLTMASSQSWGGIVVTNAAADISVTGAGTLTLGTSGINLSASANNLTWGTPITLGGSQTWPVASAKTLTVSGAIGDGGLGYGLTVPGPGTVALSAANTYGGATVFSASALLNATVAGALPPTNTLNFNLATNVTLNLGSSAQIVTNLIFTNNAALSHTVTITGTAGSALTVSPATLTVAPFSSGTNLTVNLSGLSYFSYTNAAGTINEASLSGGSSGTAGGTVTLTLAGGTNTIIASSLNVGDAGGGSGTMPASVLNLGKSNVVYVGTLRDGWSGSRSSGTIQFASGLTSPALTIGGTTGGSSLATLDVGEHDSFGFSDHPVDLLDTTAGTLAAKFGGMNIGLSVPTATSTGRGINIAATFKMGAGTLTASSLALAAINNSLNASNYTIAIMAAMSLTNGGTASITNITMSTISLTNPVASTDHLTNSAIVSLTNGTSLYATTIQAGAVATAGTITNAVILGGGTLGNLPGANLTVTNVGVILSGLTNGLVITSGQTGTFSSAITGSGSLVLTGAGTVLLSGTNTYSGNTTVSAGTLQLGDGGGNNGSVTGSVTNNAALVVANPGAVTLAGTITGSGTVTKTAAGTLTLTGATPYTGATTVTGGSLVFSGSASPGASPSVTVSNAVLNVSAAAASFTVAQALSLTNSTLTLGAVLATNGTLNLTNSLVNLAIPTSLATNIVTGTLANGGATNTITITSLPGYAAYPTNLTLIAYGTATGLVDGGNNLTNLGLVFTAGGSPAGYLTNLNNAIQVVLTAGPVPIVPITWNGNVNGNWDVLTTANWLTTAGGAPYDYQNTSVVLFNDTAGGTNNVTVTTAVTPGSLTVSNNALAYTFSGGGGIGGAISLVKQGAGSLLLTESGDTFTGGIGVSNGIVVIDNTSSGITGGTTIASGAIVQLGNNDTSGVLPAGGVTDGGALVVKQTGTVTVTNAIAGGGSVTNAGTGTLVLSAASTYTGGTVVSAGTVQLNAPGTVGTGAISLGTNVLAVNIGGATLTNAITGSGTINVTEVAGGSTVLNDPMASFTGTINLPASPGGTAKTAINSSSVAINSGATINVASGGTFYYTVGSGTMAATVNLNGPGNSENLGALRVDNGTITGPVVLQGNATVGANTANSGTISGAISDGGHGYGVTLTSGTITLSGTNTYTGPTTVTNGTLNVTGNESAATGGWLMPINLATATINFQSNATVVVAGTAKVQIGSNPANGTPGYQNMNVAGTVTNNGWLDVARGASLNINNNGLWIQNGVMTNAPPGSSGYGPTITVTNGGSFVYNGTAPIVLAPSIGAGGGVGLLVLNGGTFTTGQGFTNNAAPAVTTGTAQLIFTNNGTLVLSANIPELTSGENTNNIATILLNGAGTINTAGFSTTVTNVIGGAGGLTKLGAGTLTLAPTAGFIAYTGNTTVSGGTLLVNGTMGTNTVLVQTNATLGGSGTLGGLATVQAGGTVQGGDATGANMLTFTNGLTLGNSTNAVTYSSFKAGAGGQVAAGALTVNGTNIINLTDSSLTPGTNTLFTYTSLGGTNGFAGFKLGTVPAGATASLQNTGSGVALVVLNTTTTTLTLAAGANPSTYGDMLTFQAVISPAPATNEVITFADGMTTLGTGTTTNGVASFSTSALVAGGHSLTAAYAGDVTNTASTSSVLAQTVNTAALTVTASDAGMVYSGAAFTGGNGVTYSGFVNGETNTVLDGSLSYGGTAQGAVTPGVYTIVPAGLTATNYTITFDNGVLTISPAGPGLTVGSSGTPAGYLGSVSFSATLATNATGTVVFSSVSGAFSTNTLSAGMAGSLAITNLARGTNVITVVYGGDGNYLAATNLFNQVVTNHPPAAGVMTVTCTAGLNAEIALSDIATNWTDADGDTVELTAINLTSTNGTSVFPITLATNLDGSYVITNTAYLGYLNNSNGTDQLSYSIGDGFGGTNIGYINIVVASSVPGTNSITSITGGNPNTVTAYGVPGFNYITERSTNLTDWVNITTNTAATNGVINVIDSFSDLGSNAPPAAYYRLRWQP